MAREHCGLPPNSKGSKFIWMRKGYENLAQVIHAIAKHDQEHEEGKIKSAYESFVALPRTPGPARKTGPARKRRRISANEDQDHEEEVKEVEDEKDDDEEENEDQDHEEEEEEEEEEDEEDEEDEDNAQMQLRVDPPEASPGILELYQSSSDVIRDFLEALQADDIDIDALRASKILATHASLQDLRDIVERTHAADQVRCVAFSWTSSLNTLILVILIPPPPPSARSMPPRLRRPSWPTGTSRSRSRRATT